MSRIVFFSIPAYGHTNPTVEVVRQLVRRGHRVRYYSFEEFRAKLEGAGAEFVPCDTFLPPAPRDLGRRMGHDFSSLMAMVIDVTVAMEEKVLRELGEFRPDCVVADSICVWGKLYARRLGTDVGHVVTPKDAAAMVDYGDTVLFNKAERPKDVENGRAFAKAFHGRTVIAALKQGRVIEVIN